MVETDWKQTAFDSQSASSTENTLMGRVAAGLAAYQKIFDPLSPNTHPVPSSPEAKQAGWKVLRALREVHHVLCHLPLTAGCDDSMWCHRFRVTVLLNPFRSCLSDLQRA